MKTKLGVFVASVLLLIPSVSSAALTQNQASSLITVVQSSPDTAASAFLPLITAFSNITKTQALSLINVVQLSPGTPASAFVDLLVSFTIDQPVSVPQIQNPVTNPASTNEPILGTTNTPAPVSQDWRIDVALTDRMGVKKEVFTTADIVRFEITTFYKNQMQKATTTVTTNDPDLPPVFEMNQPKKPYFFCVASSTPWLNNGCPVENPTTIGTFDFTFATGDATTTKRVTINP